MRDPEEAEVALGIAAEPWIEGLEEGAWSPKQNEIVAAVLAAGGVLSAPSTLSSLKLAIRSPARLYGSNRALGSQVRGERSFTPPDPLFSTPAPPPRTVRIWASGMTSRYRLCWSPFDVNVGETAILENKGRLPYRSR